MNPLRILLGLTLFLYLRIYEYSYVTFYFSVVIVYYALNEVIMLDSKLNTPLRKALISMWDYPSDPQIYGTIKVNINKAEEYLKEYSLKVGNKIGFTVFIVKIMGIILEKYVQVNGHAIFGKFVPNNTADVSVLVALGDGSESELITIHECNKLTLEEISKQIQEKKKALENNTDPVHKKQEYWAKLLPTFILAPFVRILSYLSVCGLDLSWVWLPKNHYGGAVISNIGKLGLEECFLPLLPHVYSPFFISISKKKTKKTIDPTDLTLKENTTLDMIFTLDHRFMDGSLIAKMGREVK